jgi:sec-independent protein translocase protein TatA
VSEKEFKRMPDLGAPELLVILAIVVVLFGANRIPEIMGGMGKGIREFRKAAHEDVSQPLRRDARPASAQPDAARSDLV